MDISIQVLLKQVKRNNSSNNINLIKKAYDFANKKHENQYRKSGEPYIIHPINVAYNLATWGMDTPSICAGLLHDVVEDTSATYQDIQVGFGEEIAQIVDGVTKLADAFSDLEEKQTKNYTKLFGAMEKDIRVIIVKLADRLHNIQTLTYLRPDRQLAIATETIELYAPIAHKLGMHDVQIQLQDEAFKYVHPEEYKSITEKFEKLKEKNKENLDNTVKILKQFLKKQRIPALTNLEYKHLYNIYIKMKEKNIDISQIQDLFAIKIIVKQKRECYRILGALNTQFRTIPKSFRDYVAIPRNNNYQALQEIIFGEKGCIVEAQICTYEMNKMSKYGITNYFRYFKANGEENFENNLSGIKDTLELEDLINNPKEFLKTLKEELIGKETYVFTPKGEIKVLPKDAVVLDFAYAIHNDIGNNISGCMINSKYMPITTKLRNGDIVQIITSKDGITPEKEWLDIVKTAKAKIHIVKRLKETQKTIQNVNLDIFIKKLGDISLNGIISEVTEIFTKNNINMESFEVNMEDGIKIHITLEQIYLQNLDKVIKELAEKNQIEKINKY